MNKSNDYIKEIQQTIHKYFTAFRMPLSIVDKENKTIFCLPHCGENVWPSKNNRMCLDNYYSFSMITSTKLVIMEKSLYLGIIPISYDMYILIGPIMPHTYTLSELLVGLSKDYTEEEIITYYNINNEIGFIDSMRFSYIVSIISEACLGNAVDPNLLLEGRIIANQVPSMEMKTNSIERTLSEKTNLLLAKEEYSLFSTKCERYIQNHLKEKITAQELAIALNVSERTLYRTFKEQFNLSPNDYIQKKKLLNSLHMLTKTNMNISEISSYWGYSSQSHYSKAFEKQFHKTPGQYRKELKNKPVD